MAEVLSQSQIDALIAAALGGEDTEAATEKTKEKYQKYDFRSPRKYTKERLKMLNGVFENYAKVLNTRINGLMHSTCEVDVDTVDEQRYFEFSNALIDGEVVTLATARIEGGVSYNAPVIFCSSPTIMVNMMDRMMGGVDDLEKDLPSDYTYTPLDIRLYENLMKDFVGLLGSSWESYIPLKFDFDRVEPNPTLMQLISIEETVVLVSMNVRFINCSGRIDVCMPESVLSEVFEEIARQNTLQRAEREDRSEDIYARLQDSTLEITAELGRTTIYLRDIYNLNVGDVIDLNMKKDSAVTLRIGGHQWFAGIMGTHEKRMAVKIQSVSQLIDEGGSEQEDEQRDI